MSEQRSQSKQKFSSQSEECIAEIKTGLKQYHAIYGIKRLTKFSFICAVCHLIALELHQRFAHTGALRILCIGHSMSPLLRMLVGFVHFMPRQSGTPSDRLFKKVGHRYSVLARVLLSTIPLPFAGGKYMYR